MKTVVVLALGTLLLMMTPGWAAADEARCTEMFPDVDWSTTEIDGPVSVATAGMAPEMAARFSGDVARIAALVEQELGGLDGAAVCLAVPEVRLDVGDLVPRGQRLHVAVFGEEKLFALSAVEIKDVADALAFGLPQIALWQVGKDLGLTEGYPEPLGSAIAHWYLAREIDRLELYHRELLTQLFLDDPNPRRRTDADATRWVDGRREDPFLFDPQFVASQIGAFVGYAVSTRGNTVLQDPRQEVWGPLENEWRVALRDELLEGRRGSWGAEWGVLIVVVFVVLAFLLAWGRRRQRRREATPRPTPPADDALFESHIGEAD